jgi:hypothetical protein
MWGSCALIYGASGSWVISATGAFLTLFTAVNGKQKEVAPSWLHIQVNYIQVVLVRHWDGLCVQRGGWRSASVPTLSSMKS